MNVNDLTSAWKPSSFLKKNPNKLTPEEKADKRANKAQIKHEKTLATKDPSFINAHSIQMREENPKNNYLKIIQ